MKHHARFICMDEIKAAAGIKDQKPSQMPNDSKTSSAFCFPTIESLLSKDNNQQNTIRSNAIKVSPYEVKDNQIIFDNQTFYNNRNIRTATISPRSSKSPPPVHKKSISDSSSLISIDNFNPNKFTPFTEPLTLEAITKLCLTQQELFYQPYQSNEEKRIIAENISSVRIEREKLALSYGKVLPHRHVRNLSPPVRRAVDFPETFVYENSIPKQFMVCGSLPQRKVEKRDAMTASSGQRVQTADVRRSIKTHKLIL